MVSERWEQIKAAFDSIVNLDAEGRAAAFDRLQDRNPDLRAEVEDLVKNDDRAGDFLAETLPSEEAPRFKDDDLIAGRYRTVRFIGRGGMGEVYEVYDYELGERLALKTIIPDVARDRRYIARFMREVKLARNVTNRHVCRVHDVGHHDAQGERICFLTMELVEGETLAAALRCRPMSVEEAFPLVEQMADALAAAHAKDIIHRDFKPANIILAPERDGLRVVVTDFGLARSLDTTQSMNTRAEAGNPPGTMGYIAPELFWPGAVATVASDIYSFGVVIREMLSGIRPARGDSPPPPSPPLPLRWENSIRRCLEQDPERRFKTALEVADAIRPKAMAAAAAAGADTVTANLAPVRADAIMRPAAAPVDVVAVRTDAVRPEPRQFRLVTWARKHPFIVMAVMVVLGALLATPELIRQFTAPQESREIRQITSNFGLTDYPAISHDGKLLVYASDRDGSGSLSLYLRQVDGDAPPIRLTRNDADDYAPSFSADDTRIVFRSDRNGGGVYQIPTFGGKAQLVARGGFGPSYSPDGHWIAYWVGLPGSGFIPGSSRVWVKPANGGPATPLDAGLVAAYRPIWARDSKRLLLIGKPDTKQDSSVSVDWWVAPLDGGPAVKTFALDTFSAHNLKPPMGDDWITPIAWLPGEQRILFSAMQGDTTNLWEVPISAAGQVIGPPARRSFTTSHDLHASVNLNANEGSRRMFFSSLVGGVNIWSLPIDASGRVTGGISNLTPGVSYAAAPSVSAAGTEMAFITARSNIWSLRVRELQTGQEAILTSQDSRTTEDAGWLRSRISPDGNTVVYVNNRDQMYTFDRLSGVTKRICKRCGPPSDVSAGGQKVLFEALDPPNDVMMIDVPSNRITSVVHSDRPDHLLYQGRFSPDGRWVAFHAALDKSCNKKVFISPLRDGRGVKEADWIPVTDGLQVDGDVAWSPDGNLLYFLSERDGFRCVWAQGLDPTTKQPRGIAFAVKHFHDSRESLRRIDHPDLIGLSVTQDKLVFSMSELSGNIWMEERRPATREGVLSRWMPSIFH